MTIAFIVITLLAVAIVARQKAKLSTPASIVMKKYKALPQDSQRLGNLKKKLRALDNKLDRKEVNKHYLYQAYYDDSAKFNWKACSRGEHDNTGREFHRRDAGLCKFNFYKQLCSEVEELQRAVDRREEVMQLTGIDNLNLNQLLESVRSEREVIEQVTKEML